MYQLTFGRIPRGFYVLHHCDNPSCVNPKHLFLGTQTDNMQDMMSKGRKTYVFGEANGAAKLTKEQALSIRSRYRRCLGGRGFHAGSAQVLSREYQVTPATILNIVRGKNWKHLT